MKERLLSQLRELKLKIYLEGSNFELKPDLSKLKKGGLTFEVAVDPDLAVDYKKGKKVDISEVLKSKKIF